MCIHRNYQIFKDEKQYYTFCFDCKMAGENKSTEKAAILAFFLIPPREQYFSAAPLLNYWSKK